MRDQLNTTIQGVLQVPVQVKSANYGAQNNKFPVDGRTYANTGGAMGFSIWQALMDSQFYRNYKSMYDQVKINGFQCKILGNAAESLTMASGLSSVSVVTAWDRSGIDGTVESGIVKAFAQDDVFPATPTPFVSPNVMRGAGQNGTAEGILQVNRILSYGSAKQKPWSPGNAFTQYVSGYAQTAQEIQQWMQTDKLARSVYSKVAGVNDLTYEYGFPSGLSSYTNVVTTASTALLGSPSFDPVVMLGVFNVPNTSGVVPVFVFTVEYKISVSFRGSRSGTSINLGTNDDLASEFRTLEVTVPCNETINIVPDPGIAWNQARLTGDGPVTYDRVGVDTVIPNGAGGYTVTLLEHTTEVYGDAVNPTSFVIPVEGGANWSPPPVVGPAFARITVFYNPVKQENPYEELETTFTTNGTFYSDRVFSGYRITVNVPTSVQSLSSIKIYRFNGGATVREATLDQLSVRESNLTFRLDQNDYLVVIRDKGSYARIFCLAQWKDESHDFPLLAGDRYIEGEINQSSQDLIVQFKKANGNVLLVAPCTNQVQFGMDISYITMNIPF